MTLLSVCFPAIAEDAGVGDRFIRAAGEQSSETDQVVGGEKQARDSAVALVSLAVEPIKVIGGRTANGTVKLSEPAPADGLVLALSSTNPAVMVPASIKVPAGATLTTFKVVTKGVKESTPGSVSATYSGVVRSVELIVNSAVATLAKFEVQTSQLSAGVFLSAPAESIPIGANSLP